MSSNDTRWKGGKRATFQRLVVGSEVHDAFLRWAEAQYKKNIDFARNIVKTLKELSGYEVALAFQTLLEKVASPLIYLEMDWHNLPDKEKVMYARGLYAEQLAKRLQSKNQPISNGSATPSW